MDWFQQLMGNQYGDFASFDWFEYMETQYEQAEKEYWNELTTEEWGYLLLSDPMNAEYYSKFCDWTQFSGDQWTELLLWQPQYAEYCDWKKLDGENWSMLLKFRPELAAKCDWSKLDGSDWVTLLKKDPDLAENCDWKKLDGEDWSKLLRTNPEFAENCDWEKLDGYDWSVLLSKNPEFAEHCDWEKLNKWNWNKVLSAQPELAEYCDFEKVYGYDWSDQLENSSKTPASWFDPENFKASGESFPSFDWSNMQLNQMAAWENWEKMLQEWGSKNDPFLAMPGK